MNTHEMRWLGVYDDVDLSLVNWFYANHARVRLRWIRRQGRILRPCVTVFHHQFIQLLLELTAARLCSQRRSLWPQVADGSKTGAMIAPTVQYDCVR